MTITVDTIPMDFKEFETYQLKRMEEGTEDLTIDELKQVRELKVGESVFFGMGVEIKRIDDIIFRGERYERIN